jgi:hypothetical protein
MKKTQIITFAALLAASVSAVAATSSSSTSSDKVFSTTTTKTDNATTTVQTGIFQHNGQTCHTKTSTAGTIAMFVSAPTYSNCTSSSSTTTKKTTQDKKTGAQQHHFFHWHTHTHHVAPASQTVAQGPALPAK